MIRAARTTLTLVALCAIVLAATLWGWGQLTKPFPKADEQPLCEDVTVAAGEKVYRDQVVVSVYNASTRSGLAGRTLKLFTDAGFAEGRDDNAPKGTQVKVAQIWAEDPRSPDVKLVRAHLGAKTPVVPGEKLGPGVVVVVGQGFKDLVRGRKAASAKAESTICAAPGTTD